VTVILSLRNRVSLMHTAIQSCSSIRTMLRLSHPRISLPNATSNKMAIKTSRTRHARIAAFAILHAADTWLL